MGAWGVSSSGQGKSGRLSPGETAHLLHGDDDLSCGLVLEHTVGGFIYLQTQSYRYLGDGHQGRALQGREGQNEDAWEKPASESGLSIPGINCWD